MYVAQSNISLINKKFGCWASSLFILLMNRNILKNMTERNRNYDTQWVGDIATWHLGDTPRVAAGFLKFNVKFESRKIKMIAWQYSQKKSMENINRWPQWTLMWHLI